MHFAPPAETLVAAIIAHGTMTGDVTYVPSTEHSEAMSMMSYPYPAQIAIRFIVHYIAI